MIKLEADFKIQKIIRSYYFYNRLLAKVLFLTILDFDIYLKINAYC